MFSFQSIKRKKTVLIFTIFILIIHSFLISVVKSDTNTSIQISPSNKTVNTGEKFIVNLYVNPSEPIGFIVFNLSFDPMLLQANDVTPGDLFTIDKWSLNDTHINNDTGEIFGIIGRINGNVSDSGILATVSFTGKTMSGVSILDLHDVKINGDEILDVDVYDGTVTVIGINQDNNKPPLLSDGTPSDGLNEVSVNLSSLNIFIEDPEGDSFNWSIVTFPDIGFCSGDGEYNGSKSCNVSNLDYSTTYTWYVNVTDGNSWTNNSYLFTTESRSTVNETLLLSDENPLNNSINVSIETSSLNVFIQDPDGDRFNWSIETEPDIGSDKGTSKQNSSVICNISGLSYSTTYTWYVNVTDLGSGEIIRGEYFFTTEVHRNEVKNGDVEEDDQSDLLNANVIIFFALIIAIILIGTIVIFLIIRR